MNEISKMPLSMQARLLHVLQERKVLPVGGGKPADIDFALVCGSQRNLREDTDKGLFLRDLYYRINGLTVNLPALRERSDFQKITELLLSEILPGQDKLPCTRFAGAIESASLAPAMCINMPMCCVLPAPCLIRTRGRSTGGICLTI